MATRPKKRKSPFPANARTADFLRAAGWTVGKVECWINVPQHPAGGIMRDLWGVIDLVAVRADSQGVLGVQATASVSSGGNRQARRAKVLASPEAKVWVSAGNKIWLIFWHKPGRIWEPQIEKFDVDSFGDRKGKQRPPL
jgi:hypothetical protein